jgi:hypothetical protein
MEADELLGASGRGREVADFEGGSVAPENGSGLYQAAQLLVEGDLYIWKKGAIQVREGR